MPFLTAPFITRLQQTLDKEAQNFEGGAEGELQASKIGVKVPAIPKKWATAWSEATHDGAKGLMSIPIYPPINNMMLMVGKKAMYSVLITNTPYTPKYVILKQGFTAFAGAILAGWMPTYVAIPPPGAPNFESIEQIGTASTKNLPWITACATLVAQWFAQGSLVPTTMGVSAYSAIPSNWL
jgi:hypothetical protein